MQLFLQPDGAVRACCRQLEAYGNIAERSLLEIWQGVERQALVDRLAVDDFSAGCENCEREIQIEGRSNSYAAFFDVRAAHLAEGPAAASWPRWIDFNLSNACNLQCVQCSGDLSSAIRAHRDRRPPLISPYGEQFFDDLRLFIPHLHGALFAGGEPFLAAENHRVWAMIQQLHPDLHCIVTTNATQWNGRVRDAIDRVRMSFVVSLDGITPATFESIRVGADLSTVLTNLRHYRDHAERAGTTVTINHCLMPQNAHEFADLLLWAEAEGLRVDVSVVREPAWASLSRLGPSRLEQLHRDMVRREREVAGLELNADVWAVELGRIQAWVQLLRQGREAAAAMDCTVMFFRSAGSGPYDGTAARRELSTLALDGVVHWLDVGEDDVIDAVSPSLLDLVGDAGADLVGRHYGMVDGVSEAVFGPRRRYEVLGRGPDRLDARAVFGSTELRIAMVAVRDDAGRARRGRILLAVLGESDR